jgi:predicted DNA-binding transcriptional regulator YafY
MRRADRLFQIIERLRRRGVVTARALAGHLKVSERTIYRKALAMLLWPIKNRAAIDAKSGSPST